MLITACEEFGPPQSLKRIEVEQPVPRPGEALIKISAAGVGFVDGLMVQGLYQVKPALPYYPGSEFSGIVQQVNGEHERIQVGDRVMGMAGGGTYADYVCVSADHLIKLNERLDDQIAAGFFVNYATALYGFRDCGSLQAGETVLVLGAAGGVGSAAICVAKAMGARVIAAASSDAKRQAALSFGADAAVDYTADNWRDELKACTPDGLDVVYDPVGGAMAEPAFRSLAPGGRFLVVGFASGTIPKIALNLALLKRSAIVGVDWGGEYRANPSINESLMNILLEWIEQGKLVCAPVATRSMAEVRAALTDQLAGQIVGKLVLVN
ncbi:MAG: NADPH:quinone oxidoreductase family protein [Pseudomonadota bacterium]